MYEPSCIQVMIGSIIGDIVGSIYEFDNIKTKNFPLFSQNSTWTDDTILTIATAHWILDGGGKADIGRYYSRYGLTYRHPMGGYGDRFERWLKKSRKGIFDAYNSCGNGSAMRVGPIGWAYNSCEDILSAAEISAGCTHSHPEGIKGAEAVAICILMARQGKSKDEIRSEISLRFAYDLKFSCEDIRQTYKWGSTCQDTVPQAIVAFLDGENLEDCIRNAISIGGDSDTIGCITGSIAEAFYEVPADMYNAALSKLTPNLRDIVLKFEEKYGPFR